MKADDGVVRVVLVDDQEMIRAGLRAILGTSARVEVVAEAGDGFTALQVVAAHDVDVVLMDLRMPGIDGVETTRRLRRDHPAEELRILVLTTFDQDENVLAALRVGADGFLSKGVGPADLVAGIIDVASGGGALSASAAAALIQHVALDKSVLSDPAAVQLFAALTPREREVVAEVVSGKSNAEIAAEETLSPFTVKTHVNRAMTKVGARDRAHLVSLAVLAGFVPGTKP